MDLAPYLDRLRAAPSKDDGHRRQAAVWRGEPVDRLPLLFAVDTPGLEGAPRYNLAECFHDPAKMLAEHVYGMLGVAESPGDGVPSMRANFGTATLASVFGLQQEIFPDKMPWLQERLPKSAIAALEPEHVRDVRGLGLLPRICSYQRLFQERLGECAYVYLSDTQGPFDLAHLVRGDDLFLDVFDDPPFAHHLLELVTTVYIAASRAMKANLGEPPDGGHHSNGIVMAAGGVRLCEDTSTLLSPALIDEFVVPYTERALAAFGGGWIHYCGKNDHLFRALVDLPSVRGMNFGNPERHDPGVVLPALVEHNKVYVGSWRRLDGESLEAYFARILAPLEGQRAGLILQPVLHNEECARPQAVLEAWTRAQGMPAEPVRGVGP